MTLILMMPKARNDYQIIQIWFSIARFLAYTPAIFQNNSSKPNSTCFLLNFYPLILFLFFLGTTVFSLYERIYIYQKFNISQTILDALQCISELFFLESVILWSVWKRKSWEKLMRSLMHFEKKLHLSVGDWVKDTPSGSLRFEILIYHVVYLAVHTYDSYVNWTNVYYSLAFVIFRFTTYYIMFSALFVSFMCTWLKNRYFYLERFLKCSVNCRKSNAVPLSKVFDCSQSNLKEFSQNYKQLYLVVQLMNRIFGVQFFFMAIATVLEILNAVNYGMPTERNTDVGDNSIGVNFAYLISYVICYCRMVMACDSVEKIGNQIWKTYLILYESTEKCDLKEELCKMTGFVQGLRPEFLAAGFWQVNQSLLSALFSAVMTYLIIIIQFNMTLQ